MTHNIVTNAQLSSEPIFGITKAICYQDELRTTFANAMSAMYRAKVPQYGNLVQIVRDVNEEILRVDKSKREFRLSDAQ